VGPASETGPVGVMGGNRWVCCGERLFEEYWMQVYGLIILLWYYLCTIAGRWRDLDKDVERCMSIFMWSDNDVKIDFNRLFIPVCRIEINKTQSSGNWKPQDLYQLITRSGEIFYNSFWDSNEACWSILQSLFVYRRTNIMQVHEVSMRRDIYLFQNNIRTKRV
jgi:hypothetical protein